MTWGEFKTALKGLGLSQRQFSILIRASSPMTVNKWRDKTEVPGYATALIETLQVIQERNPEWARSAFAALVSKALSETGAKERLAAV